MKKLEEAVTEREKEAIKLRAESEKAAALAEQKLSYTTAKMREQESKLATLVPEHDSFKQKIDEKDRLILV